MESVASPNFNVLQHRVALTCHSWKNVVISRHFSKIGQGVAIPKFQVHQHSVAITCHSLKKVEFSCHFSKMWQRVLNLKFQVVDKEWLQLATYQRLWQFISTSVKEWHGVAIPKF